MSNAISVLDGRTAPGAVSVRDMGLQGMISVRGDLADQTLLKVCEDVTGTTPPQARRVSMSDNSGFGWMAPDEALLLVPYGDVARALDTIHKAMAGKHYLATNVSDARARLAVTGPYADEVLAKLAPVDLHPNSFKIGDFRRSRLGQVAAAFWKVDAATFHIICFRSVAEYAFDLLAASAEAGPVGYTS